MKGATGWVVIQGWREATYPEGSGGRAWQEWVFLMPWLHTEIG